MEVMTRRIINPRFLFVNKEAGVRFRHISGQKEEKRLESKDIVMPGKRLPKSIRKFIRSEKARIRRQVFGIEEQKKLIGELYQKFVSKPKEEQLSPVELSKEKVKITSKQ